jgi:hypothetical protein
MEAMPRVRERRLAEIFKSFSRKGQAFPHIGPQAANGFLVSQRFARFQHMRDPILSLARADQRKKCFAF